MLFREYSLNLFLFFKLILVREVFVFNASARYLAPSSPMLFPVNDEKAESNSVLVC